jgi:hypothetical protein
MIRRVLLDLVGLICALGTAYLVVLILWAAMG